MLETIINGGIWMIPLMFFSVLGIGVAIDRWLAFRANDKIDTRSLRAEVVDLMRNGELAEAEAVCANTAGPVAAVLLAGLQCYGKHRDIERLDQPLPTLVGAAMEDYTYRAMAAVEKRFGILTTIGNAAPLIGMLGTVAGMISAFDGMRDAGVESSAVAGGIAVALITTAAGLIIALSAVIPYNIFNAKAKEIELEIQDAKQDLVEVLTTGNAA